MSRLEDFKKNRIVKKRFVSLLSLCFIIVVVGIYAADCSINTMIGGPQQIKVADIKSIDGGYVEVSFIDKKLYINTKYVNRDFSKIIELIRSNYEKLPWVGNPRLDEKTKSVKTD